jgi:hypothetical protein
MSNLEVIYHSTSTETQEWSVFLSKEVIMHCFLVSFVLVSFLFVVKLGFGKSEQVGVLAWN